MHEVADIAPLGPVTLGSTIPWNQVFLWVVVLVCVAIVGSVVLVVIRKALMSETRTMDAGGGFGLRELDAMHERGELSDAEHARARAKMLARLTGSADDAATAPGSPRPTRTPPQTPDPSKPSGPSDPSEPKP
jgi:hypothetical protein